MDFARLRTLRELAMRKTMAAVADALFISPSAVSQQITQLEHEAGLVLVERRGRGVKLTSAGQKLVEHANHIMSILEEAKTDLAAMKLVVAGELRVAAFPSVAAALVMPTMTRLMEAYPKLELTFSEMEPTDGLAALRAWQADVALIDDLTVSPALRENTIDTIEIAVDSLYVMLPATHHLAARKSIHLADLQNEKWALDNASNAYGETIIRECRAAGFEPKVNAHWNGFEVALALVESGCSISVLPGLRMHRVKQFRGRVVMRGVSPAMPRRILLAFRRGERRNPAIAAFADALQEAARHLSE